jgi:hypothetical protein
MELLLPGEKFPGKRTIAVLKARLHEIRFYIYVVRQNLGQMTNSVRRMTQDFNAYDTILITTLQHLQQQYISEVLL